MAQQDDEVASESVVLSVPGGARSRADEWALVLASQGVRARVEVGASGYAIRLTASERPYAEQVLADYQRDVVLAPDDAQSEDNASESLGDPGLIGGMVAVVLIAIHLAVAGRTDVYAAGSADGAHIAAGQWWRAGTALCLHADFVHVLGNALFGAYFLTALGRSLGGGLALALVIASGAIGNLLNAALRSESHDSIGASTAVFGAVGLLVGLALARRRRAGLRGRRMLAPIAAGLGLLAMLGVGGARVDVGAHLAGLLVGVALGAAAAPLAKRRPPPSAQLAIGLAGAFFLAQCWALALTR
jgi:membrane associated rhomboid family serine protease